jgi:ribosomal protein S8
MAGLFQNAKMGKKETFSHFKNRSIKKLSNEQLRKTYIGQKQVERKWGKSRLTNELKREMEHRKSKGKYRPRTKRTVRRSSGMFSMPRFTNPFGRR